MPRQALGLIETVGLAAAIEAADVALKSANVALLGYELSKGGGMVTIKIEGDVGAVKAAVEAGCAAAEKVTSVWSRQIIPRPHDELSKIVLTKDTVGATLQTEKVAESEVVPAETKEQEAQKNEQKTVTREKGSKKKDEGLVVQQEITLEEPEVVEEMASEESQSIIVEELDESESVKAAETPETVESEAEEFKSEDEVCNICKDPKCPRKKGDLRTTCIHFEEIKEGQ